MPSKWLCVCRHTPEQHVRSGAGTLDKPYRYLACQECDVCVRFVFDAEVWEEPGEPG